MTLEEALPGWVRVEQCLSRPELDGDDLLAAIEDLELQVQDLCQAFHGQCLDYLYEDEVQRLASPVLESFQRAYAALDEVKASLDEDGWAEDSWEELLGHLTAALQGYPALAEWHQAQPKLSPSPFVHDLVRVGRACLEEKLPWSSFDLRMEAYRAVLDDFWQQYQTQELEGQKWELSSEQRKALEGWLDALGQHLEELGDGELGGDELRRSLEDLLGVSLQLWNWQQDLVLQFQQPLRGTLPCPRCLHENTRTARVCGRCGARLPQNLGMESQERWALSAGEQELPEKVARLVTALDQLVAGQRGEDEVLGCLEQTIQESQKVEQWLRQNPAPTGGPGLELLISGRQLLQETQGKFSQTLEDLQDAIQGARWARIPSLREELITGSQAFRQLHDLSAQLQGQLHGG